MLEIEKQFSNSKLALASCVRNQPPDRKSVAAFQSKIRHFLSRVASVRRLKVRTAAASRFVTSEDAGLNWRRGRAEREVGRRDDDPPERVRAAAFSSRTMIVLYVVMCIDHGPPPPPGLLVFLLVARGLLLAAM